MVSKKSFFVVVLALAMLFVLSLSVSAISKNDSITGSTRTGNIKIGGGGTNESSSTSTIVTAGNITLFSLNTTARTVKWAVLMGNVTGEVQLVGTTGGSRIRTFGKAAPVSQIKTVFASTNSGFKFSALQANYGKNLDSRFASATSTWKANHTDSANFTFNDTKSATVNISHVLARSVTNLTGFGKSGTTCLKNSNGNNGTGSNVYRWQTAIFASSSGSALSHQWTFGAPIAKKCSFRNESVDFQMLVPTPNGALGGTSTYSLFLDIE